MLLYLLFIKSSLPSYPLIICHVLPPSQAGQFFNGTQTYLVEQWESLEGIKFNHRAKINTKVFCLSGVLREGSFYFGQGTLGSLKKMGPFGPYFWKDPKDPYRRKDPPPLRTHGGLQYYLNVQAHAIKKT